MNVLKRSEDSIPPMASFEGRDLSVLERREDSAPPMAPLRGKDINDKLIQALERARNDTLWKIDEVTIQRGL